MRLVLCLLALAPAAALADPEAGRELARPCVVCHGLNGEATGPMIPNIGGQDPAYLVKQLEAFRDGERQDPQMSLMAAGLTDEEIRHLADWYGSIETTFTIPGE